MGKGKDRKKRILPTKTSSKIFIRENKLFGISPKLNELLKNTENECSKISFFKDIRKHQNNPNLFGHIIVFEENTISGDSTIYLNPEIVNEDDIAHELIEIDIGRKYPELILNESNLNDSNRFFISYLRGILFSGLIDFIVDRLVNERGFENLKSKKRDKEGFADQLNRQVPYEEVPFKNMCQKEVWDSIRKVIIGITYSHIKDTYGLEERLNIEDKINEKVPSALAISELFSAKANKGQISCDDFKIGLEDILKKLELETYFKIIDRRVS